MDFLSGPGLLIIFFAVFVSFVVIYLRLRVLRRRLWHRWAVGRGWTFHERWPQMMHEYSKGPLRRGRIRGARLGYEGTFDGLPMSGFRYQYTTGSGRHQWLHTFHVNILRFSGARFPELTMSPERWAHGVLPDDIQFEDAEFNDRWWVNSSSPRFAHRVIHPRLMQWLNTTPLPRFTTLWFEEDAILLATRGTLRPDEVDARLRLLSQFADRIPCYVLNDRGYREHLAITSDGPGLTSEEERARTEQGDPKCSQ